MRPRDPGDGRCSDESIPLAAHSLDCLPTTADPETPEPSFVYRPHLSTLNMLAVVHSRNDMYDRTTRPMLLQPKLDNELRTLGHHRQDIYQGDA